VITGLRSLSIDGDNGLSELQEQPNHEESETEPDHKSRPDHNSRPDREPRTDNGDSCRNSERDCHGGRENSERHRDGRCWVPVDQDVQRQGRRGC